MDFLSTLNERQREAVTATEGPLLILAGTVHGQTTAPNYEECRLEALFPAGGRA